MAQHLHKSEPEVNSQVGQLCCNTHTLDSPRFKPPGLLTQTIGMQLYAVRRRVTEGRFDGPCHIKNTL